MTGYRTRFAPSPSGPLHLGHAYAARVAWDRAAQMGGTALLRIEDIDPERCKPQWEAQIYEDLGWLGFAWPQPVMRQSMRYGAYNAALARLSGLGLLYPCRCRRADIRAVLKRDPPVGPDGVVYPGTCRDRSLSEATPDDAIRLDMRKAAGLLGAMPSFAETGEAHFGRHSLVAGHLFDGIGDVVLSRRGWGTSYHLAVVVDDGAQGITEVCRGEDLFEATPIHVLLQALLGLPHPSYHHHGLVRDAVGIRLAKRTDAEAIASYRARGLGPEDALGLAIATLGS